ncbi:MAG TPA: 16S rRNA (guanine(966)-N(2))-methyltransferase RsmD [Bacilli bacterium]
MRVISGTAKGRSLHPVPGKGTRPTTDKVKEAIFSMIGPYFQGGHVIDLFAGTGALGIEALSRGMEKGIFIDMERNCMDVIRQNLQITGLSEKAEVYRNEASKAVKALAKRSLKFNLIFLDPPYKLTYMEELLLQMQSPDLFATDAIIVLEHDATHKYSDPIGQLIKDKYVVYGDTAITIYRKAALEKSDYEEGAEV